MTLNMTKTQAAKEIQKRFKKAENLLKDDSKMEPFLDSLDRKLKWIPFMGDEIKTISILISMVRSYWKKDYTRVPVKSIIAITSALIYFLSPLDFAPDGIPLLGYVDDTFIIATVWKMVHKDIDAYRKWKKNRGGN